MKNDEVLKTMNKMMFLLVNIITLCLLILCSCGFLKLENAVSSLSSTIPHLSLRGSGNGTDIYKRDCEDNTRCEDTCEEIYSKSRSHSDCYELSIGEVADLDDLFHILVEADEEKLEDINMDHFEEYLDIGVDGFIDQVLEKIKDNNTKIDNIFKWMIKEEEVAEVLNSEDDSNNVLKELLLAKCNDNCSVRASNATIPRTTINIQSECVGDGSDDTNLFSSLLNNYSSSIGNFFLKAKKENNVELFSLGHEILTELFDDNSNNKQEECIRGFYCLLENDDTLADFFKDDVQEYIGTIETYRQGSDDKLSCRSTDFSELL